MELFTSAILCLVVAQISDVAAATNDGDVIGMAVAGCVGFVVLSVVIAIIVVSFQWKDWFNNWMRLKGKVRMPKRYFKKKEEIKKRLLTDSKASNMYEPNGTQPGPSVADTATWVEDWRQRARHLPPHRLYEEKDATVELGDEVDEDDEFTIETEVLDVSLNHERTEKDSVTGDLYPVYTTVDRLNNTEQAHADNVSDLENPAAAAATVTGPATSDKRQSESDSSSTSSDEDKITSF